MKYDQNINFKEVFTLGQASIAGVFEHSLGQACLPRALN